MSNHAIFAEAVAVVVESHDTRLWSKLPKSTFEQFLSDTDCSAEPFCTVCGITPAVFADFTPENDLIRRDS